MVMTPRPAPDSEAADPTAPVFLDAVLVPHRSLPASGFVILMLALGGASLVAGIICVLIGAWPIFGFFGLDVALVYFAFRLNYHHAKERERVRLTDTALTVERISVRGERRRWSFQPYWLKVILEEHRDESNRLLIASHGRSLVVASFLGPEQRRVFAQELRDALGRWRETLTGRG
jgi:uncharacterized membrane protein